jgi:hypothetical protein
MKVKEVLTIDGKPADAGKKPTKKELLVMNGEQKLSVNPVEKKGKKK